MFATYPNLPLIEERFLNLISDRKEMQDLKKNRNRPEFDVHVFSQVWGSTALGFGGVGGSAMTKAYTTVIQEIHTGIFGIFFGEQMAYCIDNPNDCFYEDIRNHDMVSMSEISRYLD